MTETAADQGNGGDGLAGLNQVRLIGRVGARPQQRELPSGDTVWLLRVVVDRSADAVRTRQRVDSVECAVWRGRIKRSVATWSAGDVVEVEGAIRRRFFQAGGVTASRVEVELSKGRLIRRGVTG